MSGGDPRRGSAADHILVALRDERNRELLAEWLDAIPGYRVTAVTEPDEVPAGYDLAILDERSLSACRDVLTARERETGSVYLPHVLAVTDADGSDPEATAWRRLDAAEDRLVDDVLVLPLEKASLRRRIENFLRARRASVRLAEREQQYRALVELMPETILLVEDGEIRYANDAATDLLGVDAAAAVVGTPVESFVADGDADAVAALLDVAPEDAGEAGDGFVEVTLQSAGGEAVPATLTAVCVVYDGRPMTQLVIRDLRDQRERERQLELFGRAIESAAQGITIADARQDDNPLVYANEGFERITGYTIDGILGRNCRFLQGENTDQATIDELREAIDAERPVTVEILNYRRDGTPFWNRLDIVPVRDEDGGVTHYLGLQQDVTERREREQQLSVLNRVLRHNLRNKMNVIQMYAEQLAAAESAPVPESTAESAPVAGIRGAAEDLLDLSERIRRFDSVIDTDERDLDPLDLAPLVAEAVAGLRERHPGATIDLSVPEAAPVLAHETLPAALTDLFALTEHAGPPDLDVEIERDAEQVRLEIADRGGAFDPEDFEIIDQAVETQLEHLQRLELWLIRWAVEESRGEFVVDTAGDWPTLRLQFVAADRSD